MRKQYLLVLVFAGLIALFNACKMGAQYKALVVTGQNNHNWKASSPILKELLEQTGLFSVDMAISPDNKGDMNTFEPNFFKIRRRSDRL